MCGLVIFKFVAEFYFFYVPVFGVGMALKGYIGVVELRHCFFVSKCFFCAFYKFFKCLIYVFVLFVNNVKRPHKLRRVYGKKPEPFGVCHMLCIGLGNKSEINWV